MTDAGNHRPNAVLIRPQAQYEASYRAYLAELGDEERYPFVLDLDSADFASYLRRLEGFAQGQGLLPGLVPNSTFWLVDGHELLGVSNLRHALNEGLRQYGGHIGLGVRPSCRGQGQGVRLLRATIEQARVLGIEDVHIHCYRSNPASARMIERAGGVLASEGPAPGGTQTLLRYVVSMR